jgi:hypothetical protein
MRINRYPSGDSIIRSTGSLLNTIILFVIGLVSGVFWWYEGIPIIGMVFIIIMMVGLLMHASKCMLSRIEIRVDGGIHIRYFLPLKIQHRTIRTHLSDISMVRIEVSSSAPFRRTFGGLAGSGDQYDNRLVMVLTNGQEHCIAYSHVFNASSKRAITTHHLELEEIFHKKIEIKNFIIARDEEWLYKTNLFGTKSTFKNTPSDNRSDDDRL